MHIQSPPCCLSSHDHTVWVTSLSQTRRVLLVGVPASIEMPAARLVVALCISVVFLVIQHEHKPYASAEHNSLAELGGAQITATLLFISMQSAMSVPPVIGFLCILLNVIAVPIVIRFNAKRLNRRKDILNVFSSEHSEKHSENETDREMFDPTHLSEYWKAGHESEYEVFSATFKWIDGALERPVSKPRWGKLLFTVEQLPLTSPDNVDVRHGAWLSARIVVNGIVVNGKRVLCL